MPTRSDYEKLLLHALPEGSVVRVPMNDLKEYASQRMMFYRSLELVKKKGLPTAQITSRKIIEEEVIYLEISHRVPGSTSFLFKGEDGTFQEVNIEESETLLDAEESEFKEWLLKAKSEE